MPFMVLSSYTFNGRIMQGFQKFQKKFQQHALIKSVALGLSCGVFCVSVLWTMLKLVAVMFGVHWYILIGLGVALTVGGVSYVVLKPTQKKVAKRLDEALGLDEKVQTMIEFQDSQENMVRLQRADADARLKQTPACAVKTGRLWKHFLLPALALIMLVVAILTPMKVIQPVGEEDPPYTLTDYDKTRLEQLIENVKASDMEIEPKLLIVEDLEGLLQALQTVEYKREMKALVVTVIADTARLEKTVNTYDEIYVAFSASENEQVKSLANVIGLVNVEKLDEEWNTRRDSFIGENASGLTAYEKALNTALFAVETTRMDDALMGALKAFVTALQTANASTGLTADEKQAQVDAAFYTVSQSSGVALLQQYDNKQTADMVVAELMDIFGITAGDLPSDVLQNGVAGPSGDTPMPDNDQIHSGGGGEGEIVYGSNDTIYYPEGEKYVSYGEVLTEFRDKAYELIDSGEISEELAKQIRAYFAGLNKE